MDLLIAIGALLGGLVLLSFGADRLIAGATGLARRARLSEAVIGATIVAAGTSMPEMVASVSGAWAGQFGLAVGNVVGSNSFNIGLILGLIALIAPMTVATVIARRDVWVMLAATAAICAIALICGAIPRPAAAGLLLAFVGYVVWSLRQDPGGQDADGPTTGIGRSVAFTVIGIVLLTLGGAALVHGAVALAKTAGISDAVIGLTIVAAGTSAPELITSLLAARRGQHQIAVANIVGSNTFNILGILGVTGLFSALPVVPEILQRDLWVMAGFAIALPLAWGRRLLIGRTAGCVLLLGYLTYLGVLLAQTV
jgi:cation:H+ antiporter